jgi:hypothetical protein
MRSKGEWLFLLPRTIGEGFPPAKKRTKVCAGGDPKGDAQIAAKGSFCFPLRESKKEKGGNNRGGVPRKRKETKGGNASPVGGRQKPSALGVSPKRGKPSCVLPLEKTPLVSLLFFAFVTLLLLP